MLAPVIITMDCRDVVTTIWVALEPVFRRPDELSLETVDQRLQTHLVDIMQDTVKSH